MTTTPGLLHIRADAGPGIGTGHVRRQLALADEWRRAGGDVELFSLGPLAPHLVDVIRDAGVPQSSGQIPSDLAWIVLDSYRASRDERERLMSHGQLLVVDDLAQVTDQVGTMILDQNLGASRDDYPAIPHHLLGPGYALLRRDFSRQRDRRATSSPEPRVLVTLGGDPDPDLLSRVVDAVASVVPAGRHRGRARRSIRHRRRDEHASASPSRPLEALPGSSARSVSRSVLIVVSPNQTGIADALDRAGAAVQAGVEDVSRIVAALLSDEPRLSHSRDEPGPSPTAGARGGSSRHFACRSFRFGRHAWTTPACCCCGQMIRTPDDRASRARTSTADEHVSWLAGVLADPARSLVVVETAGSPVGQVRLDLPPASPVPTVSIALAPGARGRGLGPSVLRAGIRELRAAHRLARSDRRVHQGDERGLTRDVLDRRLPARRRADKCRRRHRPIPSRW